MCISTSTESICINSSLLSNGYVQINRYNSAIHRAESTVPQLIAPSAVTGGRDSVAVSGTCTNTVAELVVQIGGTG